jgi:hypothetical protein
VVAPVISAFLVLRDAAGITVPVLADVLGSLSTMVGSPVSLCS